jgi:hypothetical protein
MLGSSDTALSGSLSHMDLPGIVQMLAHTRQTGSLYINSDLIDGIMFFEEGNITHAECGELVGDDAVVEIVKSCNGMETGSYKFLPGESTATRSVLRSATELMLNALRELDEATRGEGEGGV